MNNQIKKKRNSDKILKLNKNIIKDPFKNYKKNNLTPVRIICR